MALGRFPSRTILTQIGEIRPFSDIGGRHVIHLNNGPECRHALSQRLEKAGCTVNTRGTDWLKEGNFANPPELSPQSYGQQVVQISVEDIAAIRRLRESATVVTTYIAGYDRYSWRSYGVSNNATFRNDLRTRLTEMYNSGIQLSHYPEIFRALRIFVPKATYIINLSSDPSLDQRNKMADEVEELNLELAQLCNNLITRSG